MTVKEIIKAYLDEHGYDGLCNPDQECGCRKDDLCPFENVELDCQPGHKRRGDDGDWRIFATKESENKDDR